MQVFFIEKKSKFNLINKIKIEGDKIVISRNYNQIKKIGKIITLLRKNNCNKVILSKNLKEDKNFCNLLYTNNIEIINGKILFKKLIPKILKKIIKQTEIDTNNKVNLAILQNDNSKEILTEILKTEKNLKNLNIVTNNPQYFAKIKQDFFQEKGFIITLTNNKRKALAKSNIIINVDFPEEMINKYIINDNATIINLEEKIKILKKRFNGKIINE